MAGSLGRNGNQEPLACANRSGGFFVFLLKYLLTPVEVVIWFGGNGGDGMAKIRTAALGAGDCLVEVGGEA